MASKPSSRARPNIRMVAEHLNLSPATVSLALRGSESIAPETRARVLAAARELNYIPAPRAARPSPAAGRTLLFLTKDFGDRPVTANPFYGEILGAVERASTEAGDRLIFSLLPEEERRPEQLAASFAGQHHDGLLVVGAYPGAVIRQLMALTEAPIVLVDNIVPGLPCDSVMADDFGGARLAVSHLFEQGHRRIAMIAGDLTIPSFAERYRGYRAACAELGLAPAQPAVATWDRAVLREALDDILAQQPRPTAIFCATDAFAVFVMELLRDVGLHVPDDLSVVGFDNLPIARMAHPPLTTMHNHPQELGRIAMQRLLLRISGNTDPALNITVATQLVVRESTKEAKS
ncbi:MAG TPA: LacI family DNA-binding transcriptional regulator [Roseiflexaceae bacterium]|nr:LacI family DNA-binding transcriptional regulator [Roseiflexaceae bacterium]